ncbi:fibronectin type III domain protein [Onchocerca flexuosa]|uniref:Fibronectin type III domain protein n=1 Tax=Onchocerca flexuosa TaxID=387005 RepID=A0A238BXW3_9BILA|nr:fibronectin type III domain protein [Onchocerca flexuosa]
MNMISFRLFPLFQFVTLTNTLGPPKLDSENDGEIWFQVNSTSVERGKFTLPCYATGNPETFEWFKDGKRLEVDGNRIAWEKQFQSGTIIINDPQESDQGYYQCHASNIFGTAVSNKFHVQIGVLDHFALRDIRRLIVDEGRSLSIRCDIPYGIPKPSVFWLYRDAQRTDIIETIRRKHIAVDTEGTLHFTAVEKHDGRQNLIYQCAATSPVLGEEYRAGNEFQLIVNSVAKSNETIIHKLWFSPEEVSVKVGSKLKLMCIFGGRPLPNITWSKLNDELPITRLKDFKSQEADYGKALIIENVRLEDAGIYECRSQHLFHQMQVTITAAPFWIDKPPQDIDEPEGNAAEIHCITSGIPTPIVQWFINGVPLHELVDNDRRMILNNGQILRIVNLHHDIDTAVYQCNASNPLGYVFGNAFVNVRAYAPYFKMPSHRIWNVVRKSTVEMSCDVDAAPEALVKWVDANDHSIALVLGKIQIFPNHTLRISQVNSADEGLYYCNVSNKYGINRSVNQLQVFSPTHFIRVPSPKKSVLEANESIEYICEAVCDPRLTIEYSWTHNGVPINDSVHFKLINNSLLIVNARGFHSGAIDCIALTEVDVKISGTKLIVLDVPDAPKITQIDCNERRAMVKWRRPDDRGDKIKKFLVQMQTEFEEGLWQTVAEEKNGAADFFQATIALSPWVNYTFRVIAQNSRGESEPGFKQGIVCSTKAYYPYTNPKNVRAEGNEPNNMIIEWKPMNKYDWNGPGLQYIVRYKLNEPGKTWTEIRIEDPLANHTVVREQPTFREYLIQVESLNNFGRAIVKPISVKGYSGEDTPLLSPIDFSIFEFINCTAVHLIWKHVNRDTVRGHFKGYLIDYWENEKPFAVVDVGVEKHKNETILYGLKPITNYTTRIRTANSRYLSESPSTIRFTTPEGIPSKVHNMRVRAVGARSLYVTWEPPRQPNGYVRGYFITFENSSTGAKEETFVLNRQLYYLNEEGEPDTGYKVSVWAETKGGEGPKVVRPVRTWPLREPDIPNFTVEAISPTMARVEWLPSNGSEWAMPGSTFLVNYSIANSNDWIESEQISLPQTEVLLSDLEEDTRYKMIGIAKEGQRQRTSEVITIRSLSRATITHISHESLQSAAWFIAVLCAVMLALFTAAVMCCCERQRSNKYSVKQKDLKRSHHIDVVEDQWVSEFS